ncbi:SAM-dependent methyltransferase [Microbispora amethystogenes]|uniref:SAM-dependent methyltransferase n=1 Tax=Microbispora amethystogenes TaxID=1427754 RepID=UPI0033CD1EF4
MGLPEADHTRPTGAGIYSYMLGSPDGWTEADRVAADRVLAASPEAVNVARRNRTFLMDAVQYCTSRGIDQFLDIGSGMPDATNVHQVAQADIPTARTVYVDNDPYVQQQAAALIVGDPHTAYVQGDLRAPQHIIKHPDTARLIDWSRPVAVLLVTVLHYIGDGDDPYGIVEDLVEVMAPGSVLVISHTSIDLDGLDPAVRQRIETSQAEMATPIILRNHAQIERFFTCTDLIPPGLVYVEQWKPDGTTGPRDPIVFDLVAGVAVKK